MRDDEALGIADYPLAEQRPELVHTARGRGLDGVTLDAVMAGEIGLDDLAITPDALRRQAAIARAAGRATLALNFERAAEMVAIPQDKIFAAYEMLRPGRAKDKAALLRVAAELRREYAAETLAAFVEEAAEVYDRRGLFAARF